MYGQLSLKALGCMGYYRKITPTVR